MNLLYRDTFFCSIDVSDFDLWFFDYIGNEIVIVFGVVNREFFGLQNGNFLFSNLVVTGFLDDVSFSDSLNAVAIEYSVILTAIW